MKIALGLVAGFAIGFVAGVVAEAVNALRFEEGW